MNKFKVAIRGLIQSFKHKSCLVQLILAVITIIFGFIFKFNTIEWLSVIICIGLVITSEIINTCIEKLCDYIQKEKDEGIGLIKDIAAGAVLFSAIVALTVAIIIVSRRLI